MSPSVHIHLRWVIILAILLLLLSIGLSMGSGGLLASPTASGRIPFGEWSGSGTLVYERWGDPSKVKTTGEDQSASREYPSTLSISPGRVQDRDVILLEICSARGILRGMEGLGAETHIRAALVPTKRASESSMLYQLVALQLNPKASEDLKLNDNAPPFSASCTSIDGRNVLQIVYADRFVDTFRFDADRVEKYGTFSDGQILIQWSERLTPRSFDNTRVAVATHGRQVAP